MFVENYIELNLPAREEWPERTEDAEEGGRREELMVDETVAPDRTLDPVLFPCSEKKIRVRKKCLKIKSVKEGGEKIEENRRDEIKSRSIQNGWHI